MPASYLNRFMGSAADCLDAFTAGLFVADSATGKLKLEAFHSLSDAVIPGAVIGEGQGFLSWVMKNQRPLQVPRFKRDSRTLGFYADDVGLKSFLAVPLPRQAGVICVDSRSRFAFSAKHERILESLGNAVVELLDAERSRAQADFYARVMQWQMKSFSGCKEAVAAFLEVLGLDAAVVVRHLEDTSFFVVEDVFRKGEPVRSTEDLRGKRFPLGQGMAGWVAKHRSSLLLDRRKRDKEQGFILHPDEPLNPGPVVIGIFCPYKDHALVVNYCFLFSGPADISFWPDNIVNMLEFLLKGLLPWR